MPAIGAVAIVFVIVVALVFLYWVFHRYRMEKQQEHFMNWAGDVMRSRTDTDADTLNTPLNSKSDHRRVANFHNLNPGYRSDRSDSTWSETSSLEDGTYGSLISGRTTPDLGVKTSIDGSGVFGSETETRPDPERIEWDIRHDNMLGVPIMRPSKWVEESIENPNVRRFLSPKGEEYFKSINIFVIDLSTADSRDQALLEELVLFYKQEVRKQGDVSLNKETFVPSGKVRNGVSGPRVIFQSSGKRGLADVKSQVMIGVHGAGVALKGHIITCTFAAVAFDRYKRFVSFVFQKFCELSGNKTRPRTVPNKSDLDNGNHSGRVDRTLTTQFGGNEDNEERLTRRSSEFIGMSL